MKPPFRSLLLAAIAVLCLTAVSLVHLREETNPPAAAGAPLNEAASPLPPTSPEVAAVAAEASRQRKTDAVAASTPKREAAIVASGGNIDIDRLNPRLLSRREHREPDGRIVRSSLYEADFFNPILRVEEVLRRNSQGELETLAHHVMVGDHLIAQADPSIPADEWETYLAAQGFAIRRSLSEGGFYLVSFPPEHPDSLLEASAALSSDPHLVRYVEPDYLVQTQALPNDPSFSSLWGLNDGGDGDIDAPEAWEIRTDASGVVVAIIDTGIRYTHEDLAANRWLNPAETPNNGVDDDQNGYTDDYYGFNATNWSGNCTDDHGHGTHVAGTVGAVGDNGIGVTGVAWNVQLMPVKFMDASGTGTSASAVTAIHYARRNGATVMNNSWVSDYFSYSVEYAVESARQEGIIFVAAAGNKSRSNDSQPTYPASYDLANVVCVASHTTDSSLSGFSNYGINSVDVSAPGSSINSTRHMSDSAYGYMSGTSMATPHVAGIFAVLRAQYPGASYLELIDRLYDSVEPVPALASKVRTGGRVSLYGALSLGTTQNPPQIVSQPVGGTYAVGAPVNLSVTVTGEGTLTYQWFRDGAPIGGATSPTYAIIAADLDDAGSYTVEVSSGGGTATSNAAVVQVLPLAITAHPQGGTFATGETITLSVTASGAGPLAYQWRKGGVDLTTETSDTLVLASAPTSASGTYDVLVTDGYSVLASSSASVTVLPNPPQITSQPQGGTFAVGQPVNLSVTASGEGTLSYQWKKDGANLPGATTASYAIGAAQVGDSGSYTVTVSNSGGSRTSTAAAVSVIPLTITSQPQGGTFVQGDTVTLNVTASGVGSLGYQWRRNGGDLAGATNASLTLNSIQSDDAGSYDVVVSNGYASVQSATVNVAVLVPPSFTLQPSGASLELGASHTLSTTVLGTEPITYQWFLDGSPIEGASGPTLDISDASAADAGDYFLRATNAAGSADSATAIVDVLVPPSIVAQPQDPILVEVGNSTTLSVQATGSGPLTYQWYAGNPGKTAAAVAAADGPSMTTPEITGWSRFWVRISNAAGSVDSQASTLYPVAEPLGDVVVEAVPGQPISIEAEHHTAMVAAGERQWSYSNTPGQSGGAGVIATPNSSLERSIEDIDQSPSLTYPIDFAEAGIYYVWVRGKRGYTGDLGSDSVFIAFDGGLACLQGVGDDFGWAHLNEFGNPVLIYVQAPGVQDLTVYMREDGFRLDKILLTTQSSYVPEGEGPTETPWVAPPQPPVTPTNVTAIATLPSEVLLTWTDNSTGELRTLIERSEEGGPFYLAGWVDPDIETFYDGSLMPDTTYAYRLYAVTLAGASDYSQPVSVTTPPLAQSDGAFVQESDGSVVIEAENYDQKFDRDGHAWEFLPAGGLASDAMWVAPDSGQRFDAADAPSGPELLYNVQFDTPGTYRVWILGSMPEPNNWSSDSVHVGIDGVVPASAEGITGFSQYLAWKNTNLAGAPATVSVDSAGAHTLHLFMREDGMVVDRFLITPITSFVPTGNGPAESSRSDGEVSSPAPPSAPQDLTATDVSLSAVSLQWADTSDNEDAFILERAINGGEFTLLTGSLAPDTTSYVDTHVAPDTTYTYRLAATNADGPSPWTPELIVATPLDPVVYQDASGLLVIEAENYHQALDRDGHAWLDLSDLAASEALALVASPDDDSRWDVNVPETSPELRYEVNFDRTGTHYIWVRARIPASSTWSSDSLHAGLGGQLEAKGTSLTEFSQVYEWSNRLMDGSRAFVSVGSTGNQTFSLWMREDGLIIDKVILSDDRSYVPAGEGPAQSSGLVRGGAVALTSEVAVDFTFEGMLLPADFQLVVPLEVLTSAGDAGLLVRGRAEDGSGLTVALQGAATLRLTTYEDSLSVALPQGTAWLLLERIGGNLTVAASADDLLYDALAELPFESTRLEAGVYLLDGNAAELAEACTWVVLDAE